MQVKTTIFFASLIVIAVTACDNKSAVKEGKSDNTVAVKQPETKKKMDCCVSGVPSRFAIKKPLK